MIDDPQSVQEALDIATPHQTTNTARTAATARQQNAQRAYDARGTRAEEDLPHACRCGSRWSGGLTAHCAACHRTFSGIGPFDRHRRDDGCADPATVGLVLATGRAFECWGNPPDTQDGRDG